MEVKVPEVTKAHKDSLNNIVENFYALNILAFQASSTGKGISNIFNLFTDNF
jgi:hypothetical protein